MRNYFSKNRWLNLFLFAVLATSLLTPIGSILSTYDYIPKNDYIDHVAATVQAEMALTEGQFPLRVSPWQHEGIRYAEFQFYGQLPYLTSGLVYKFFLQSSHAVFHNAFNAIKTVLWILIIFSAIYSYRFARLFTQSEVIALLAAIAYLFSPYLIININLRGDYTETFAQCLLPAVMYYSFKSLVSNQTNMFTLIFSAIGWCALSLSHLITFAYSFLFFTMFLFIVMVLRISQFKEIFYTFLFACYGWILAAWYIIPIIIFSSHLPIGNFTNGHGGSIGLRPTSIFNLFALRSGNGAEISPSWPGIYTSIGPIYLFALLAGLYLIQSLPQKLNKQFKWLIASVCLLLLALVMTWSGVNFWRFLPSFFAVGQWGYRFLTQIMWLGIIPFVFSIEKIFGNQLDMRHLVIGIFLICFSTESWLTKPSGVESMQGIVRNPDIFVADSAYLMRPETLAPFPGLDKYGFIQIPLLTIQGSLLLDFPVKLPMDAINADTVLIVRGVLNKESKPGILQLKINDKVIGKKVIGPNEVLDWRIPLNLMDFHLFKGKNAFFSVEEILDKAAPPSLSLVNILPIHIQELVLAKNSHPPLPLLSREETSHFCQKVKNTIQCDLKIFSAKQGVQLPVLYYPDMLEVKLDGTRIDYEGTFSADRRRENEDISRNWVPFHMTTIAVPTGEHKVIVKYVGLLWANNLSVIAWLLLTILAFHSGIKVILRFFQNDYRTRILAQL